MEKPGTLDSSEKTIAILGNRWWPQTAKQEGDKISKTLLWNIWKKRNERLNVGDISTRSRTVLRLERDAWSMAKPQRQATNEYAAPTRA